MSKKWILRLLLFFLASLTLSACDSPPSPPLRVGSNIWQGYESLYLARHLGYFESNKIHLVELPSATTVMHAFRNGNLEAAALTLDEALTLLQDNIKLQIILVMDVSNGGDVLLGREGITGISDLKGRSIAYENTAVGAILLTAALEKAGLSTSDVTLVPTPYNDHHSKFQSGSVDAIVTFEPVRTQLLNTGAINLFDSAQIPGRIVDVLVISSNAIKTHTRDIKTLVTGYFRALHYLKNSQTEAAKIISPRLGLTAIETIESFKGLHLPDARENHKLLMTQKPPLQETAKELIKIMLKQKLLERPVKLDNVFSAEFLPGIKL